MPLALAGSLVAAAVVARALLRIGWRPRVPRPDVRAALVAWRLSLGAGAAVAAQIVLSVTVAASAAIVTGGATIFSYASMIIMVLTAALASPLAVVFAPVVAREWDRQPATLVPLALRAYRAGALLLVPAAAAILLLGLKPAEFLLAKVEPDDLVQVFELVLVLVPGVLGTVLASIPMTGVMAEQRLGALAGWSLAVRWHTSRRVSWRGCSAPGSPRWRRSRPARRCCSRSSRLASPCAGTPGRCCAAR